jgi:hypothetical protein
VNDKRPVFAVCGIIRDRWEGNTLVTGWDDPIAFLAIERDQLAHFLETTNRATSLDDARAMIAALMNDADRWRELQHSLAEWLLRELKARPGPPRVDATDEEIFRALDKMWPQAKVLRERLVSVSEYRHQRGESIDAASIWGNLCKNVGLEWEHRSHAGTLAHDCFESWFCEDWGDGRFGAALVEKLYGPNAEELIPKFDAPIDGPLLVGRFPRLRVIAYELTSGHLNGRASAETIRQRDRARRRAARELKAAGTAR